MAIFIKEGIKDFSMKITQYNSFKYQSGLWKLETNKYGVFKNARKNVFTFYKNIHIPIIDKITPYLTQ
jgi:hypothetical protein